MASNEGEVQKAILDYLAIRERQDKLTYWRSNNIPPSSFNNGKKFYYKTSVHAKGGIPDIIVVKDGLFIGLEVKDKSKQSESQIEFEKCIKKNGGQYYIVRSIDDVINIGL